MHIQNVQCVLKYCHQHMYLKKNVIMHLKIVNLSKYVYSVYEKFRLVLKTPEENHKLKKKKNK